MIWGGRISAAKIDAYARNTCRKSNINLPTCWRARSSNASDKSKPAHRPKHCTKPPIFGGVENAMA
jgi:hypothetical protein